MLLKITPTRPRLSAEKKRPKSPWCKFCNWRTYCGCVNLSLVNFNSFSKEVWHQVCSIAIAINIGKIYLSLKQQLWMLIWSGCSKSKCLCGNLIYLTISTHILCNSFLKCGQSRECGIQILVLVKSSICHISLGLPGVWQI